MPELSLEHADFEALARGVLATAGSLRFRASGGSMRPFIWNGDLVELGRVGSKGLRRGDVVLCRLAEGRLALHRMVRVHAAEGEFLLQGDARLAPDGWFPPQAVLGRVLYVWRGGRRVSLDNPLERALAGAWVALAPLRRGLFALARLFRQAGKALK
jgi:signal peptidase I